MLSGLVTRANHLSLSSRKQGLRGIASFIVLTGHLSHGWAPYLNTPAVEENGHTLLFQYPVLRLIVSGRAAVAVFFIITGYVNSLNPVKNFRANNATPSLQNMSRSSFTRTGRLFFPDAIAVLISWACSQLGLYHMGTRIDCRWYRDSSIFDDSFRGSLYHLWDNLTLFWHTSESYYDGYHWTMAYILLASFRVYLVLLVLAFVRRRFWYAATAFLYWYAWRIEDCEYRTRLPKNRLFVIIPICTSLLTVVVLTLFPLL